MSTQKQTRTFSYYKSSAETYLGCAVAGCKESGKHKVLPDPRTPQEGIYMCLQHAKEYNKAVNYFKNMGIKEIEAEIKADTVWRLPTWPLRGDYRRFFVDQNIFSFFEKNITQDHHDYDTQLQIFPKEIGEAAKTIGVSLPISLHDLKKIYKIKVKQHHPDLNRDKKGAEEELKKINIAYKALCDYLANV